MEATSTGGAAGVSVFRSSKWSGETSACACAVTGSKHAIPSAAAKTEAFTTVEIFITFSLFSLIFAFEFFISSLNARAVSPERGNRSMQGESFVGKREVKP